MSDSSSPLRDLLFRLSQPIAESLINTPYIPHETSNVSVKSFLHSLLLTTSHSNTKAIHDSIKDFVLASSLLSFSSHFTPEYSSFLSWIPNHLSSLAIDSFSQLSDAYVTFFNERNSIRVSELGFDVESVSNEKRLVLELMPQVLPFLKDRIKESSIDKSDENDEFSAASARVPVGFAVIAACQFRWFVTQVGFPHLGKLCGLVIPCALTAVDHWSPEVKGQGMASLMHIGKNVDTSELGGYQDVILDACCQNIASSDEIWHPVVETSIILVTLTQRSNPRSPWFERMLTEMLSHLERQPRNKERRIAWLKSVDPLFNAVGLMLLAHFRRIFPLFFQWMHADDDDTLILVLRCTYIVLRVTWIRNSPYVKRLVDELALVYKEAALRRAREEIRTNTSQILILLQESKGLHFKVAWEKHQSDVDLSTPVLLLSGRDNANLDTVASKHCGVQGSVPLKT
ncbi:hypothetical protein Lal_00001341 [Lupinus albus]|uniref:Uncharacterized protein n=1 Tax=Lupinus albus TaxID=3870 RepID=A0A6A4NYW4_LUPAL|nr:hypothetical protein Lalb_Chr18g0052781 [Lupinus albus]KAF1891200.1 hypothetical protein Lal_00001341 [Lupinus albus]